MNSPKNIVGSHMIDFSSNISLNVYVKYCKCLWEILEFRGIKEAFKGSVGCNFSINSKTQDHYKWFMSSTNYHD